MDLAYLITFFLRNRVNRLVFSVLARKRPGTQSFLEGIFCLYSQPESVPPARRIALLPFFFFFELGRIVFGQTRAEAQDKLTDPLFQHGIALTMRSVATYGITHPQRFTAPPVVVWNFTNRCNLKCRHCYQGAGRPLPDELNLSQRLDIVRQLADQDVFSIAFSGGEPLMDAGLWEVLGAAHRQGLYVSIATNGTLLTETVVQRISAAGVNYVEISLDSVHPEVHDRFRGIPGLWKRTVTGIRNAVAAGVFSVGIASTITQLNYQEVEDLISFARDLGADKFYAFNFIPTGRGKGLIGIDLSPRQREQVLEILWQHYLEGDITCMTTAPQFARVCLVRSHAEMAPTSHYTVAKGKKAATVAEFVGGCGVGRAYCAIQPNGVVSPCVFMPIPVGDLRTTPFTEIWNHSPELNDLRERTDLKDHCGSCAYRSSCGGCRARAYAYFHDFKAPDPGCINNQSAYDQLLGEAAESAVRVSTVE